MGFVQRRLVKWVIRVVSHPRLSLALCGVGLLLAVGLAAANLGLSTSQDELMTPKLKFFREYQEFARRFPENESFVVILEPQDYSHPPPGKRWMQLADRVAADLLALEDVRRVDYRLNPDQIGEEGLLFADWETLRKVSGPLGSLGLLGLMNAGDDPLMNGYTMIPDETKRGTPAYDTQRILVINVYARRVYKSLKDVTGPLERMRAVTTAVAKDFPEFKMPVISGRPALEADEMATSDRDARLAEILGLSLVFVVLLAFLRNVWLVLVAELCLGVGIGWTFGWATLTVGRLNLLSLVFVIALIGIGMDYLIQILTRYRFEKKRYARPEAVWARVFRYVSAPISTACCGAAGAFFVAMLTDFQGARELGIIAGGGLLLCLLAGYTVLPALLTLFPAQVGTVHESRRYRLAGGHPPAGGWRLLPAGLWIVVAGSGLWLSLPPKFDPNLLKLQADELASVREVRKLPTWYAVVTSTDLDRLREIRAKVLGRKVIAEGDALLQADVPADKSSTIDRTESLLSALDKQEWLRVNGAIKPTLNVDGLPPILRDHLVSMPEKPGEGKLYALYIYPKADLWETGALEKFVAEVESRVPEVTGIAPQLLHSTEEIHKAFMQSTVYALVLIFILVLLDLRKPGQTFLAISVLALGLPMLLLVMYLWHNLPVAGRTLESWSGIPGTWNFANFFALPILIGAGHEYGVFLVHRYREALHDPRRVWRTWDVSDRALLLCGIVTSASFGFMMLAKHHGLQSLGWVMAVGTACIYLAALLVLRPILTWRLKQKRVYHPAIESEGEMEGGELRSEHGRDLAQR